MYHVASRHNIAQICFKSCLVLFWAAFRSAYSSAHGPSHFQIKRACFLTREFVFVSHRHCLHSHQRAVTTNPSDGFCNPDYVDINSNMYIILILEKRPPCQFDNIRRSAAELRFNFVRKKTQNYQQNFHQSFFQWFLGGKNLHCEAFRSTKNCKVGYGRCLPWAINFTPTILCLHWHKFYLGISLWGNEPPVTADKD